MLQTDGHTAKTSTQLDQASKTLNIQAIKALISVYLSIFILLYLLIARSLPPLLSPSLLHDRYIYRSTITGKCLSLSFLRLFSLFSFSSKFIINVYLSPSLCHFSACVALSN
jgi:hypothetical protein